MNITQAVKDWLGSEGWDDEIKADAESGTSQVETSLSSGDNHYSVYIEADESREWLTVFFYLPVEAPTVRYADACVLANQINFQTGLGRFAVSQGNGVIQYKITFDFEGIAPSPMSLGVMMAAAVANCDRWCQAFEQLVGNEEMSPDDAFNTASID